MKIELSKIAQDLEQGIITDKEARTLLLGLLGVVERISRMKDDSGREGCTYGDTDYDSMTVVYGYNMAIDNIIDTIDKM
jgi:hypothetical protein